MSETHFVLERFASLAEALLRDRATASSENPDLAQEANELIGYVRKNGGQSVSGVAFLLSAPTYDAAEEWAKNFLRDRGYAIARWQQPEPPTALAARLNIPVSRIYTALKRRDRPIVRENRGPSGRLISVQSNALFDSFLQTCEPPAPRPKASKSTGEKSKKSPPKQPSAGAAPAAAQENGPELFDTPPTLS